MGRKIWIEIDEDELEYLEREDLTPEQWFVLTNVIKKDNGCWHWVGSKWERYGRVWTPTGYVMSHRFSFEAFRGPIPPGKQLDHVVCDDTWCANPWHTEPSTLAANVLRGRGVTAVNARKTRCKNGHRLSGDNLQIRGDGSRRCRTCFNEWQREWRASRG